MNKERYNYELSLSYTTKRFENIDSDAQYCISSHNADMNGNDNQSAITWNEEHRYYMNSNSLQRFVYDLLDDQLQVS